MKTSARLIWGYFTGSLAFALHAAPLGAIPEVHNFVLPAIESTFPVPSIDITPNPQYPNALYYAYDNSRAVAVGDFNGDGLPDIAYAPFVVIHPGYTFIPRYPVQIWINTGGGHFEQQTTSIIVGAVPTTVNVLSVLVADYNYDGVDDIFFVDSGPDVGQCEDGTCGGERNTFLLSGTDGKLHDATDTLPDNVKSFNHVSSLADINGDGNMDVVLTRLGGTAGVGPGGVSFLLGDGRGGFSSTIQGIPPGLAKGTVTGRAGWGTTTACDLDGDDRADLITGSYHGGTGDTSMGSHAILFYRQAADGTFAESARINVDPAWFRGGAFQILCGDIDGDGRNDVFVGWEVDGGPAVVREADGGPAGGPYLQILRNGGDFHFTDITLAARGTYDGSVISKGRSVGLAAIQLIDFNGDGYADILLRGWAIGIDLITSTTTSFLWLNDGAGKFTPWHLQQNGVPVSLSVLAQSLPEWGNYLPLIMDANGDGRRDLVVFRQMGGDHPEPMPQTRTVAISTLLRAADAVPAGGPNYQGLWWNPASESGWGINSRTRATSSSPPGSPTMPTGKALWLSMTANKTAEGVYSGTLYQTHGPAFSAMPFSPAAVTATAVGTGTLTFSDGNNGSFAYIVNGIAQTKAITRQVFGPVPTCTFGAQPNLALATNYQDLWWAAPAGVESGWGVNFTHQGDIIFATWFTYDVDGTPLWLSATANKTAPGVYTGTLYRTTGPAFSAVPFLPANVGLTAVGTLTLTFANGNSANVCLHGQRRDADEVDRAAGLPHAGNRVPVNVPVQIQPHRSPASALCWSPPRIGTSIGMRTAGGGCAVGERPL